MTSYEFTNFLQLKTSIALIRDFRDTSHYDINYLDPYTIKIIKPNSVSIVND